ncbi:MAG: VOC family protein [Anaerolineales bacterium]|nr:VOC family protein [Anaerolineales bacterium]
MDNLENNIIVQIGIIVKDAEKTAARYAEIFGFPKPEVVLIANEPIANTIYRGRPSDASGKAAFFDMGAVQMELIEPIGGPSTWEEFLRTRGEGIHHIAFKVQDFETTNDLLAGKGMAVIQSGAWTGGRYAYLDSAAQLGTILEILNFEG